MYPPLIHHPEFTGKSGGGVYSDTLTELDYRSGQVLDAIDQAGIAENTIVVWNSYNPAGRAPYMGGSNGPWRGHFASGFEGGMRAPAIVRRPGKVQAGAVTDEIVSAVERLPTLANLVGESQRVPNDRPIDGVDASAFLLGESPTTEETMSSTTAPMPRSCRSNGKRGRSLFATAKAPAVPSSNRNGR